MQLKSFFISAVIMASLVPVSANAQYSRVKPYAYGHSIDVLYGDNFTPYKIDRAVNPSNGIATGGKFDIRYTTFIRPWIGVYAQAGVSRAKESATGYLGAYNEADGGLYRYKAYSINSFKAGNDKMISAGFGPYFILGAAFRYDIGQFSFRPRLGVGNGRFLFKPFAYEKVARDGVSAAPSIYYRSLYQDVYDYLIDSQVKDTKSASATIIQASIQVSYTFNDHFYFSLEGGLLNSPTRVKIHEMVYTGESDYNPESWAQAVYDSGKIGQWTIDTSKYTENLLEHRIGGSGYLQFGIGWNFGRDHSRTGWNNDRR